MGKVNFAIVIPAYNSMDWLPTTLQSVKDQAYDKYKVCVVDDASTDERQAPFIKNVCEENGWSYILRDKQVGALCNQWDAIHEICDDPEDVIVFLDGDDWLVDGGVLEYLNNAYSTSDALLTYGNYLPVPFSPTCPRPRAYPKEVVESNSFRKATHKIGILFNHLRTVKYKLIQNIDPDKDLKWPNGEWFQACADTAIMVPALELAGSRHLFLNKVLYHYNSENPISDWRKHASEVDKTHAYILQKLPRKQCLQD